MQLTLDKVLLLFYKLFNFLFINLGFPDFEIADFVKDSCVKVKQLFLIFMYYYYLFY